jgi:hypothetical protein
MLFIIRADAILVIGQCSRESYTEYNRMVKVIIHEIYTPRSAYRMDFLGFLQQCWKYLPTYISKDDPFECSFSQDNTTKLPKHWTGGKNAAGLLKYIATFIANYLNAIDKLSDDIEEQTKVLQMRPSIGIDMIVVLLSDQFTNKRWYASNKEKRKSMPKPQNVKVKAEIYGNNGETSNTVLLLSFSLLFCLYFILFSLQIILAIPRFE